MIKTTKEDFEYFQKCFKKWQEKFQLNCYWVYFYRCKLEESYSRIVINGAVASVHFATEWEEEGRGKTEQEIDKLARHECLHLLLGKIANLAVNRFVSENELREEEEFLVRKLEYIFSESEKGW